MIEFTRQGTLRRPVLGTDAICEDRCQAKRRRAAGRKQTPDLSIQCRDEPPSHGKL